MKKYSLLYPKYWNILFFVFITSCSIFHNQFSTHSKKEQRFQEALQHEWDKTHDPKLGFVPSNRLQSASLSPGMYIASIRTGEKKLLS